jgi:aminoglycoside phosphotransferase (APT) family kinase protein
MSATNEAQRFAQLVQAIRPNSKLLRTWPLTGGISAQMNAFAFERPDGQIGRMVLRRPGATALKQNPQAAAVEFKLLQTTQALGLATPAPLLLDQSGKIFPTPFLVIEYVEGKTDYNPADLPAFTRQMATHLANIHRVADTPVDLSFLPIRVATFAETFGPQPSTADQSFAEERIRLTLAQVWPITQRNMATLLHGDFWPGNLLWQDETLVAVIDWEDARVGDPLMDLAISRLDLLWIFGVEAFESFTRHYQSLMALDYTNLPYWDLYAALRLVRMAGANLAEWAAFYPPFGRHDITEQTIRAHYAWFITQAYANLTDSLHQPTRMRTDD